MELSSEQLAQNRREYDELLEEMRRASAERAQAGESQLPELSLGSEATRVAAQGDM